MKERTFWTSHSSEMRHTSISWGTTTDKTHVSGVHTIPMCSTSRRCMNRRLVFGFESHVGAKLDPFFSLRLSTTNGTVTILYPFLAQLQESEIDKVYFQQDGATAHTVHMSMALLDDVFADRISSKTIWPPRSPDLSLSHFFSLGCNEKLTVFQQSPHNWWFEDGHHRIHSECGPCYTEHGLREHSLASQ